MGTHLIPSPPHLHALHTALSSRPRERQSGPLCSVKPVGTVLCWLRRVGQQRWTASCLSQGAGSPSAANSLLSLQKPQAIWETSKGGCATGQPAGKCSSLFSDAQDPGTLQHPSTTASHTSIKPPHCLTKRGFHAMPLSGKQG